MEDKRLKQALRALYADGVRPCIAKRRKKPASGRTNAPIGDQLELLESRGTINDPYNRRP
ncbi:MAG: hypothetical protein AB8G16_04115 [Gammaproteobacteria bacterium]